ncbi:MAG: molecular chaperone [Halanaeroarchaeum sp.]
MSLQDDPAFARARKRLYELLAAVFDGDVEVLARAIREGAFVDVAETLPVDLDTEALARTDLDEEALEIGYDNLFEVPGPHYVPPFASAHADEPSTDYESDSAYHEAGEAGELFGDPAESMSELHVRADFEPERGEGIPDHLAAEFEFMAALATTEAHALEDEADVTVADVRDLEREVLEHLDWVENFADAVRENDSAEGLFAELASFSRGFVAWDRAQIRD